MLKSATQQIWWSNQVKSTTQKPVRWHKADAPITRSWRRWLMHLMWSLRCLMPVTLRDAAIRRSKTNARRRAKRWCCLWTRSILCLLKMQECGNDISEENFQQFCSRLRPSHRAQTSRLVRPYTRSLWCKMQKWLKRWHPNHLLLERRIYWMCSRTTLELKVRDLPSSLLQSELWDSQMLENHPWLIAWSDQRQLW